MGIFDGFLQQLGTGDQIKDYKHASRLFVDNNYALSPKYTWLFHVFFDVNPGISRINTQKQMEAGMLVKSTDLPKFKVDTKTYNNYNRPTIAQSKARFEDVNITFHDDSSDVVRNLWFDYYDFYYRDMDNSYGDATGSLNPIFQAPNKQRLGQRNQFNRFGYSPRSPSATSTQYLQAIRIYSLHQKRFSEYTLINPVINSFRHGTHTNGSDSTLEHSMSVSYETVLYATGWARAARGGFAQLHYDKSPSPLTPAGGGTNSFAGPGGILNTISEVIGDASGGNFGSALFKAARGYQKNKNVDLKGLAAAELTTALVDLAGGKNPTNRTFVPYRNGAVDSSGASPMELKGGGPSSGSVSSNGSSLTVGTALITGGVATALAGKPELGIGVAIAGLAINAASNNQVQGGSVNKVVNLSPGTSNNTSSNAAIAATVLTAVSSDPLPLFSFAAAIAKRNEEVKARENAEAKKRVEEQGNAYKAYYSTGSGAKATTPTYETGTNTTTSSTPSVPSVQGSAAGYAPSSYSAGASTANQSASETITNPPSAGVTI